MGRGKIEIKRIENVNNRVVTFSKRRNGLVKKAKEITVLCDAKVALIVFASNGKMTDYCCPSMDLGAMLDQYQKLSGKKLWDAKHEVLTLFLYNLKFLSLKKYYLPESWVFNFFAENMSGNP